MSTSVPFWHPSPFLGIPAVHMQQPNLISRGHQSNLLLAALLPNCLHYLLLGQVIAHREALVMFMQLFELALK